MHFHEKTLQLEFLVFLVVFCGDADGDGDSDGDAAAIAAEGVDAGAVVGDTLTFVMMAAVDMGCVATSVGDDDVDTFTFEIVTGELVTCFTLGTTFITFRTVMFRFSTFPLITAPCG